MVIALHWFPSAKVGKKHPADKCENVVHGMIISKGLLCMERGGKGVYSEQDVNNSLLMEYEATERKDCFRDENQVEFSKGGKNT